MKALSGLLALLLMSGVFGAEMPRYSTRRYSLDDGLPQNTVRCLCQSRDGYLWIGTGYGVARFDGVRMRNFTGDLLVAEPDNLHIWQIVEDSDGEVWIRTGRALFSYAGGKFQRHSLVDGPLKATVQHMAPCRSGGLWLATLEGVKLFRNGVATNVDLRRDGHLLLRAGFLAEDGRGRLWVLESTDNGGRNWTRFDPQSGAITTLEALLGEAPGRISALHEDRSGRLWLSTPGAILCWDGQDLVRHATTRVAEEFVEDLEGAIWFRDGMELVRFHDGQTSAFSQATGLADTDLRCVLADLEGNVWVGTGGAGLNCLQPQRFTTLWPISGTGHKNEVFSVAPSRDGGVWLGSSSGLGLVRDWKLTVWTNPPNAREKVENTIRPVLEDRSGTVWAGVNDQGLHRLRAGRLERVPIAGLAETNEWSVTSLMEDGAGRIWAGTDRFGVICHEAGTARRMDRMDGMTDSRVTSLMEAPDGDLWIGTVGGGINILRNGQFRALTTKDGLLDDCVGVGRVEAGNTVWVSTPKGLNRIRGGEIRAVRTQEGLPDSFVYSLLDDGRGNYWAHGRQGVWRIRQPDLHAVADGHSARAEWVMFGQADGMQSTEGNGEWQPNAAKTQDGRLWFPTTRGVAVIDVGHFSDLQPAPVAVLEQVFANGNEVDIAAPAGQRISSQTPGPGGSDRAGRSRGSGRSSLPVRFTSTEAGIMRFRYTAPTFVSADRARFRHRLRGLDDAWHEVAEERTAYFTNLKPGDYTFEVMACNAHGAWAEAPATFAFSLAPSFTQTPWFPASLALGGLALAGAFVTWRLRWQRRALHAEQAAAVAEERARIARDLHDDLGTALTGLALELDVLRRDRVENISGCLAETAGHIRELAGRMREVVWAVNPRCDTLPSFAVFLEQHAVRLITAADMRARLDFPDTIPALPLAADTRHQLALAAGEALNNAVRHSAAKEVTLRLRAESPWLTVEIADDGRGFSQCDGISPVPLPGQGLDNLRTRLESVGGSAEVVSAPGQGTRVVLRVGLVRDLQTPMPGGAS